MLQEQFRSPIGGYHIPESYPKQGPPVALQYIREPHGDSEAPHKIDKPFADHTEPSSHFTLEHLITHESSGQKKMQAAAATAVGFSAAAPVKGRPAARSTVVARVPATRRSVRAAVAAVIVAAEPAEVDYSSSFS